MNCLIFIENVSSGQIQNPKSKIQNTIITLSVVGMTIIYSGLVWAMNSLVSSDDIGRMKKAKISDAVIHSNVDRRTDLFRNG